MKKTENQPDMLKRLSQIIEIGSSSDRLSRGYDFYITLIILVNLTVSVMSTFDAFEDAFGFWLELIEGVTVALFLVDYCLRLLTAKYIYPSSSTLRSVFRYVFSFTGVVDLLSFLPFYLPVFFPAGAVAFRIFRVVRIFRLFRINAYYDSLNAITEVVSRKRQQLASSVFMILVLTLAASLCMYSVEHEAQPEVFSNAFSGIWWAVSTLLTVGYGDIYPVTALGRILGIGITFLGVGMVAIPTGIISAGFVEQYARIQNQDTLAREMDIHFIRIELQKHDSWVGKTVAELRLPQGVILTAIYRREQVLIPRGDTLLELHDVVILGAEPIRDRKHIQLKELVLLRRHPWNGQYIRDIDLSRQSLIVLVRRDGRAMIPNGSMRLREGDTLLIHTKMNLTGSESVEI